MGSPCRDFRGILYSIAEFLRFKKVFAALDGWKTRRRRKLLLTPSLDGLCARGNDLEGDRRETRASRFPAFIALQSCSFMSM